MGKVITIEPGQPAQVVEHQGDLVQLADLHRYTDCDCVDARSLGPMPVSGRICDVWFDDNGLLNDGSVPNRQIGENTIVVGKMVLCARNPEGDSLPFTDDEAEAVRAFVERRWAKLPPDHPKPEPTWEFISVPRPEKI